MIDGAYRHAIASALLFLACQGAILFWRLLPLSNGFSGLPGPAVGLCLMFAWVLRRPDQVGALPIVLFFVIEDVLLLRPLGLWAFFVLLGSEAARGREHRWRDQPFMVEWLRVSILIGMMMLGYRVVQVLFLLPVPVLGQVILEYLATVACYPFVVFGARWLIGLRRISPAEAEMMRYNA